MTYCSSITVTLNRAGVVGAPDSDGCSYHLMTCGVTYEVMQLIAWE